MNNKIKTLLSRSDIQKVLLVLNGLIGVKSGLGWVNWFLKVCSPLGAKITPALARSAVVAIRFFYSIYKTQGRKGLVIMTKSCYILTMQAIGGQRIASAQSLGPGIARTKKGLPRVIPREHRTRMMAGDVFIIRLWLSWFSIYRILTFPTVLKLDTITDPGVNFMELQSFWFSIRLAFVSFLEHYGLYNPVMLIGLVDPIEFVPLNKSTPVFKLKKARRISSSFNGIYFAAKALVQNKIWPEFERFCYLIPGGMDPRLEGFTFSTLLEAISELVVSSSKAQPTNFIGKLGFKEEAAGKVRVFAMVDCWTQWLMRPLHLFLFNKILPLFPTDGTHDQLAPIRRLLDLGLTKFWCYDLSAATDRLPILIQHEALSIMFGNRMFGEAWSTILVDRDYQVPKPPKGVSVTGNLPESVRYKVGQPMGALSSWAMLALLHHFIVQWAAYKSGKGWGWTLYAVLGDDVVICDGTVANEYLRLMTALGVKIGVHKSLISRKGCLEFAKRYFVNGKDCSPVPFKEMVAALADFEYSTEFVSKYSMSITKVAAFLGLGYKVRGSLHSHISALNTRLRTFVIWDVSPWGRIKLHYEAWFNFTSLKDLGELLVTPPSEVYLTGSARDLFISFFAKALRPAEKLLASKFFKGGDLSQLPRFYVRSLAKLPSEIAIIQSWMWWSKWPVLYREVKELVGYKEYLLSLGERIALTTISKGIEMIAQLGNVNSMPSLGEIKAVPKRRSLLFQLRLFSTYWKSINPKLKLAKLADRSAISKPIKKSRKVKTSIMASSESKVE